MSNDDTKAIEQTIQTYFDGLYEGDADKLASVFHPSSNLTWDHDGKIGVLASDWQAGLVGPIEIGRAHV